MNVSPLQDVSLYELAFNSGSAPRPMQVSPTIFKSMITTFIDILVDQDISATLLLKLPRGPVWQNELNRLRQATTGLHSIYLLTSQRDEASDKVEEAVQMGAIAPEHADDALEYESTFTPEPTEDPLKSLSLPLAAESQLRREYFLLVLSEQFSGLILTHRPRSLRQQKPDPMDNQELSMGALSKFGTLPDEDLQRKHPLLGLCSFEPQTIQRVLEGIHRAICFGQSQAEPTAEIEELLVNWDQLVERVSGNSLELAMVSHIFTRQVQQQENIWHSSAIWRKQSEVASTLQLENEELLNAIRLKNEFLKTVGQELRTPLSTMKTALTLLNSPNLKPAQRNRYMEMLSHECDRQSSLISSVLDLVQLETEVDQSLIQPVRLADSVPGIVSTYQPLAQEKGVMLAYTVPEDLPPVACLSNWLRQIVINLLHNSIKFTSTGGQVWVKAKQQGDYIQVEFRDTGIGIPMAEIPKIFDRFYRIRHSGGDDSSGAGLGLSIVQQLLLRCGGSISVKSKPGEGSIFTVLLPIYR